MKLENEQAELKKNVSEILGTIPEFEKRGVDKSIIEEQLEIADRLSKFSDKLTPIIEDSKKRGFHSHSSKKYRDIANEYPRIKKTILSFLMLFLSSLAIAIAIEGGVSFLDPLKSYSSLFKAITFFSIAPVLLSIQIIAYKTGAFPGRLSHTWIEKDEQPIRYWLLMLLWPSAPIGCIYVAWYWVEAYINA